MKSLIAWMLLCPACFADNTFGLGEPEPEKRVVVSEMFGLETSLGGTSKDATIAKDGIFPNGQITSKIANVAVKRTERESSGLLPIIPRNQTWTDPDVGNWTPAKLKQHLLGEFQSPQHRGSVSSEQLEGRSFADLLAIHANLHEGWAWDGKAEKSRQQLVEKTLPINTTLNRNATSELQCPGGICPTNNSGVSNRRNFGLFRKR